MLRKTLAASAVASALLVALAGSAGAAGMEMCKADAARLCPGVPPGKGRIMKCMKAHSEEVSVGCAKALKQMKGAM